MEQELYRLQQEIELCRAKLNQMPIDDPEILSVSRKLDVLLDKYLLLKQCVDSWTAIYPMTKLQMG